MSGFDRSEHVTRGRLVFAAALAILPIMDAIAKLLSTRLPVVEIIWARFVVYSAAAVPIALLRHGRAGLVPRHPGWQLVRGTCTGLSSGAFFMAVSRMPVADAMAVFLIYPALLLCISGVLLGERPTARQWLLVACGFAGALLVIRPSFHGIADGAPWALASAFLYAFGMITTRRLAGEHSPFVTTALSALIGAVGYSCLVPAVWRSPESGDLWLLLAIGAIAALGHFGIVVAHRWARASQLAPLGYTEIAGAVIAGMLMFNAVPTTATWCGIALIVSSGIAATWSRNHE